MTRTQLSILVPTVAIICGALVEGYLWRRLIRTIDSLIARIDAKIKWAEEKG